jgi:hypothetical protein
LLVAAALGLLGGSCALAQTADLNGDGTPDSLQLDLGFHPDAPVTGRVTVESGVDGATLLQIDGPAPNDAFAFSADFISDLNGDGTPDLAVRAPR